VKRPTLSELKKHYKLYGMSDRRVYKGKQVPHKTYALMSADGFMVIARKALLQDEYVALVKHINPKWEAQARASFEDRD